jgi:ATP-dependent helicase HrpA
LPKAQRREIVPVPATAERLLRRLESMRSLPFYEALSSALQTEANLLVPAGDLAKISLAPFLRLHLALLDAEGRVIVTSREAGDLRRAARAPGVVPDQPVASREHAFERDGLRTWDFDELPERVPLQQRGVLLELYPALADRGDAAALVLHSDAQRAGTVTRGGVLRLLSLALASTVRALTRELGGERELMLLHHAVGPTKRLPTDIVERALLRVALPPGIPTPRTRAQFEAARERGAGDLVNAVHELATRIQAALAHNLQITRALDALSPALDAQLVADLRRARARLIYAGFVATTPDPWLDSLPRYLRALERRIAKLPGAQGATARGQHELRERWERYEALHTLAVSLDAEPPAALVELRWLIEEYAVSLFAQELKTSVTVSPKRLEEAETAARRALDALR